MLAISRLTIPSASPWSLQRGRSIPPFPLYRAMIEITVTTHTIWITDSEQTEESALAVQVRKAYKKSALQLHPDKALAQCRFSVKLGSQGLDLASRSEVEPSTPPNIFHQQWSRVHHSEQLLGIYTCPNAIVSGIL